MPRRRAPTLLPAPAPAAPCPRPAHAQPVVGPRSCFPVPRHSSPRASFCTTQPGHAAERARHDRAHSLSRPSAPSGSARRRPSSCRRPRRPSRAASSRSAAARRSATLKASVSSESIDVPEACPAIDALPPISADGGTAIGSSAAPTTISWPRGAEAAERRGHGVAVGHGGEDDRRRRRARSAPRPGRRRCCRCSGGRRARGRAPPCRCRGRSPRCRSPAWPRTARRGARGRRRPRTATRSPARAPLWRSALNVVMPAHSSGAASSAARSSGIAASALALTTHVVGVAAVEGDPGDAHVLAGDQVPAAARLAVAAVAAEPADADALADLPALDALAERRDPAGDLVAGDDREGDARVGALLGQHVAVADAAGLDPDQRLAAARAWAPRARPARSRRPCSRPA